MSTTLMESGVLVVLPTEIETIMYFLDVFLVE